MNARKALGLALLTAGLLLAAGDRGFGQAKKSDSVVKAKAEAGKVGADGKQVVTITLTVSPKFHIYANPVGNDDFSSNETSVSVTGKTKLEGVKVDYPAGKVKKDKVLGNYKIYEGKVTLKANVTRAKGDTGPLAVVIKVQACDDSRCLEPAKITLTVP
jgi:Disulphide bond corrector protein DsbC